MKFMERALCLEPRTRQVAQVCVRAEAVVQRRLVHTVRLLLVISLIVDRQLGSGVD